MSNHNLGTIAAASTRRIRLTFLRDGVAWAGINSVTLTFRYSNGTEIEREMTVFDDTTGKWDYVTEVDDLTTVGDWKVIVRVQDGDVDDTYPFPLLLRVTRP